MTRPQEWWQRTKRHGAVWEHSGNPKAPHVVLRGDKHSDIYIDTLRFLSNVPMLHLASVNLEIELRTRLGKQQIDWVFGSPMAGIPIATTTAALLAAGNIGFTEKGPDNKSLTCRFDLEPGETFLCVEEMTTSGGTPNRAINAILERNPEATPLDFVGAFLIRCDRKPTELKGKEIVPLISLPELGIQPNEWAPEECPLCKAGSKAIKDPKQVWRDLLRTMIEPTHEIPNR